MALSKPSSQPHLATPVAEEEVEFWVPAIPLASAQLAQERQPPVRWGQRWSGRALQQCSPWQQEVPWRNVVPAVVPARTLDKVGGEGVP